MITPGETFYGHYGGKGFFVGISVKIKGIDFLQVSMDQDIIRNKIAQLKMSERRMSFTGL